MSDITENTMEPRVVARLAIYLLLVTILSGYMIISLWSSQRQAETGPLPAADCRTDSSSKSLRLHPASVGVGGVGDIYLVGCGFTDATVAKVNGVNRQSQFIDANHIRLGLAASDVSAVGTLILTTSNGTTELGTGNLNIVPPVIPWKLFGWGPWPLHPEVQLLLLVLFTGVFGSSVYSLKSLGDYRGDNRLFESWHTFYVIQPFTGMGIAFLLYVVIRGGFLSGGGNDSSGINQFGICAIAGLAGAFSDTAFLKLREVFQTLFKPQDDRSGKIGPKITTTALEDGVVGEVYNQKLQATGGLAPLRWSVTPELPASLILDPATGAILGTPSTALEKTKFTFTVTDSSTPAASVSGDLSFEIKARLTITSTALSAATVATAYNQKLEASGGVLPLKWTVAPDLPSGVSLNKDTGAIEGTPTAELTKTPFKFTVTDSAKKPASATAELGLEVKPKAAAAVGN